MIPLADELQIREYLSGIIATATGYRVIPAPIYFNGVQDYWATYEDAPATPESLDEIDDIDVQCAWLYLKGYVDDPESPTDSPKMDLNYDIVLFQQSDRLREDENITPDAFNKMLLQNHNDFVGGLLNLKAALQGLRTMGLFPTGTGGYAQQNTQGLIMIEEIDNRGECEFVPGITGYRVVLREPVQVQLVLC